MEIDHAGGVEGKYKNVSTIAPGSVHNCNEGPEKCHAPGRGRFAAPAQTLIGRKPRQGWKYPQKGMVLSSG